MSIWRVIDFVAVAPEYALAGESRTPVCYPQKEDQDGVIYVEPRKYGVYRDSDGNEVRVPLTKSAIPTFPDGYLSQPSSSFVFPQYGARYWAGIDCSGFIQRSVNSADKLNILGAKSGMFDLGTGSCDANAESCPACDEVGSQTFMPKYASRIYDSKATIKVRAKALSKVRKGDLAVYKKHVALVHSDELSCGPVTKDKNGKEQINCIYNIIHAYGRDSVDLGTRDQPKPTFTRKVRVNRNNEPKMPDPTGFGRIKLWD